MREAETRRHLESSLLLYCATAVCMQLRTLSLILLAPSGRPAVVARILAVLMRFQSLLEAANFDMLFHCLVSTASAVD
jgi:hypothetical protein